MQIKSKKNMGLSVPFSNIRYPLFHFNAPKAQIFWITKINDRRKFKYLKRQKNVFIIIKENQVVTDGHASYFAFDSHLTSNLRRFTFYF